MATLNVTKAELQYLVDYLGSDYHWPHRNTPIGGEMLAFIPVDKRADPGGGPAFRLRVLALLMYGRRNNFRWPTMPLEVSLQELWLLDSLVFLIPNLVVQKMEDGQPFLTFAIKVWDLLIKEHAEDLPEHLRISIEESDARNSTSTDNEPDEGARRSAIEGADAALAAVEAALAESRASTGAS